MNRGPAVFLYIICFNLVIIPIWLFGLDWDIGKTSWLLLSITSFSGLIYQSCKIKYASLSDALIGAVILYTFIHALFAFPGWSLYRWAEIVGVLGIAIIASKVDAKYIFGGLLCACAIQMITTYLIKLDWSQDLAQFNGSYDWGTFRHRIRYSTVLFSGLIGFWYFYIKAESAKIKIWIIAGAALLFMSIFQSKSNSMMFLSVNMFALAAGLSHGKKYFIAVIVLELLAFLIIHPAGFALDAGRRAMWLQAYHGWTENLKSILFGQGLGWWNLTTNIRHPHSILLSILSEQGIIGLGLWGSVFYYSLWNARRKPVVFIGLGALLLSYTTNSMLFYPEQALMGGLFIGMGLNDNY